MEEWIFFGVATKIELACNSLAGWTSFTVCGKLRRLVKVKKVLSTAYLYFSLLLCEDLYN